MAGPPITGELGVYNVAQALLAAALTGVTTANGAPGRVGIYTGSVVIENDCCDGQLWVAWHRTWATHLFPTPDGPLDLNLRGQSKVVEYEVGIVRCDPTQNDEGAPPTAAAIDAAAQIFFRDQYYLEGSILCLLREWDTYGSAMGAQVRWTDIEPEEGGGCAGSKITIQVAFPTCSVCPE